MKTVGLREAKAQLSAYVARAQRERVLILRHGKPAAVVIGVEGQDLEQVLLAHDPELWKLIRARRAQPADVPLAKVRERLERPKASRTRRGKKARK